MPKVLEGVRIEFYTSNLYESESLERVSSSRRSSVFVVYSVYISSFVIVVYSVYGSRVCGS